MERILLLGACIQAEPIGEIPAIKDGKLEDDLAPYVEAMKAVAAERHVTLLDLHARGIETLERMGPAASEPLGPISKDGRRDYTHLAPLGRDLTARQLVGELGTALPELAKYVRPERVRNP
jgi:lysophospholipase L1-like esterase